MRIGFALPKYLRWVRRPSIWLNALNALNALSWMNAPGLFCALGVLGCAAPTVPDPAIAVQRYVDATKRGDAESLYHLLSSRARAESSRTQIREIVQAQRVELGQRSTELARSGSTLQAQARLRFQDGEEASMVLQEGSYRVANARNLPGGAQTPTEALRELRAVVARRNYTALLRMLTVATRKAIENDLQSLVAGLEHAETLDVTPQGDRAIVTVPGGHIVKLRRENGSWFVEDFE